MTIAATGAQSRTPVNPRSGVDVGWRALRGGLWVARRDGRHLGTVERGRRWTASDADGEPIGSFRTLRDAQAAVADPVGHRAPGRRATVSGATVSGATPAVAVLCAAAVLSAACSIWTALLL